MPMQVAEKLKLLEDLTEVVEHIDYARGQSFASGFDINRADKATVAMLSCLQCVPTSCLLIVLLTVTCFRHRSHHNRRPADAAGASGQLPSPVKGQRCRGGGHMCPGTRAPQPLSLNPSACLMLSSPCWARLSHLLHQHPSCHNAEVFFFVSRLTLYGSNAEL